MTTLRAVPAPEPPVGYVAVRLNHQELRCLELLAAGLDSDQIASDIGVALRTAKGYVLSLFTKFGAHTRAQLIHEAHRHGWLAVGVSAVAEYHARMITLERRVAELEELNRELRAKQERARAALR